jgi:hypothetical protein
MLMLGPSASRAINEQQHVIPGSEPHQLALMPSGAKPFPQIQYSRRRRIPRVPLRNMSNRNRTAELFGINPENVSSFHSHANRNRRLENLEGMVHGLVDGLSQTLDAAEGGREDAVGLTEGLHKALHKLGDVIQSTRRYKVLGIFDMILFFYYTLYTLLRLAAETIFFIGMNMSNYVYAIPFVGWMLLPFIWIVIGALYLILYHTGLFVASFGQLHRTGNEYLLWELIFGYSVKLLCVVGRNVMNIKGIYKPFIDKGYNIVAREFNLSDTPVQNKFLLVGRYIKDETSDYVAEAGGFLKNKTGDFVEGATQHISSAVSDVANRTVTAAIEKMVYSPIAIAADLGDSIASGASEGVKSLGSSIASGAAVGYSGAQSLGATIGETLAVGASGAKELGSSLVSGVAVGASGAKELGSSLVSGVAVGASGAKELGSSLASGASEYGTKALGAAAGLFKGRGGAINGSILASFREFDNIHILEGKQLDAFNSSRLGTSLFSLKSEMDNILIENLNEFEDKPIDRKRINFLDKIILLFTNKAAPLFIKEVELSIPFYEYVKKHKITFNQKYRSGLVKALCKVDIIKMCKSLPAPLRQNRTMSKNRRKSRRIK